MRPAADCKVFSSRRTAGTAGVASDELQARPSPSDGSGLLLSPEFARLWERHDVQGAPMLTKTFRHPVVGEVTVDCDSLTLTDRDQHLVLYTAPPGSHSAEALALLNVLGSESVNAGGTL